MSAEACLLSPDCLITEHPHPLCLPFPPDRSPQAVPVAHQYLQVPLLPAHPLLEHPHPGYPLSEHPHPEFLSSHWCWSCSKYWYSHWYFRSNNSCCGWYCSKCWCYRCLRYYLMRSCSHCLMHSDSDLYLPMYSGSLKCSDLNLYSLIHFHCLKCSR